MDFLTPPTDNLYKFLAIAGIVTALAAGYFERRDTDQIRQYNLQTASDSVKQDVIAHFDEVDYTAGRASIERFQKDIDERTDRLEESMRHLGVMREKVAGGKATEEEKSEYERQSRVNDREAKDIHDEIERTNLKQRSEEVYANVKKGVRESAIALAEIKGRLTSTSRMIDNLNDDRKLYHVAFWFGLALATVGFVLWYVKVQRFQDSILVADATGKLNPPADAEKLLPPPSSSETADRRVADEVLDRPKA